MFCETKEDAEKSAELLKVWLKERGLELSPDKTRILHLTDGFDFLGFNIRQYEKPLTAKRGYQLFTKPSKKSVVKIREKLRERWLALKGQSVKVVIKELNPIIRGWANYFRIGVAKEALCKLDDWMFRRIKRYVRHMHPTKPAHWLRKRYFGKLNPDRNDNWVFGDKQTGMFLQRFGWFPIERHILVLGDASPDDPNLREYWAKRNLARAKDLIPSKQKLSRKQKGLCPGCGETLFNDEELQVHHIKWKSQGGMNTYRNFALLHLYCHQQIHAKHEAAQPQSCKVKYEGGLTVTP